MLRAAATAASHGSCDHRRAAVDVLRAETSKALHSRFVSEKEKARLVGQVGRLQAKAYSCGRGRDAAREAAMLEADRQRIVGGSAVDGLFGLGLFGL